MLVLQKNYSCYVEFDRNVTDLVKFLSCLLIALHHYSQYVVSQNISHKIIYEMFSTQGGFLGVAIFFFLSGYGLMKSEQKCHLDFNSFFRKRYIKLYLPVVLSAIIWIPICHFFVRDQIIGPSIIIDFFWGWGDGILWFVKCLLLLYLFFFLYAWTRGKFSTVWVRLLTIGILTLFSFVIQYNIADFSSISIPLFYLGIVVADFKQIKLIFQKKWVIGSLVSVIFLIMFLFRHNMLFIHAVFNYLFIFLWIVFSSNYIFRLLNIPKCLGNLSYDVYLVHNKCLIFLRAYFSVVPLWIFVMSSIVISILFYKLRINLNCK